MPRKSRNSRMQISRTFSTPEAMFGIGNGICLRKAAGNPTPTGLRGNDAAGMKKAFMAVKDRFFLLRRHGAIQNKPETPFH